MRNKTKKTIKKIFIFIMLVIAIACTNNYVFAVPVSINTQNLGSSSSGSSSSEPAPKPKETIRYYQDIRLVSCDYEPNISYNRLINLNAYDMKGRTIIPFSYVSNVKFKAGTWIGINLREYKYSDWNISDIEYYETFKDYVCAWSPTQRALDAYQECQSAASICAAANAECSTRITAASAAAASAAAAAAAAHEQCVASGTENCPTDSGGSGGVDPGCSIQTCETCTEPTCPSKVPTRVAFYKEEVQGLSASDCMPPAETTNLSDFLEMCAPASIGEDPDRAADESNEVTVKLPNTSEIKECKLKIVKTTATTSLSYVLYPSLEFEIINTNNYDKNNITTKKFTNNKMIEEKSKFPDTFTEPYDTDDISNYLESITVENVNNYISTAGNGYHSTYEYSPEKVCINIKTSDVSYQAENSCPTNENEIEPGETSDIYLNTGSDDIHEPVNYWRYFIPLNTNTTSSNADDVGFYISISNRSGRGLTKDECITALRRYPIIDSEDPIPNYMDFIIPYYPGTEEAIGFRRDYYEGITNENESEDYKLFESRNYLCKFATRIKFNIEQKFYGEAIKDGKEIIKGYGFYYRPINPNSPFPNPIASDSIWQGLYNNEHNQNKIIVKNDDDTIISTTDLNESFSEITYTTSNISISDVRNDSETNKIYTSWRTINLDGTSQFIRDNNLRAQNDSQYNLYKLGCGPETIDFLKQSDGELVCE